MSLADNMTAITMNETIEQKMMIGVFVTGTDTNVGKTWVSKKLIKVLMNKGIDVMPRKPVESGWPSDVTQSDAWGLANIANKIPLLDEVCPNHFKAPISPDSSALLEGKKIQVNDLKKQCLTSLGKQQFLLVEGAGGFYSPLCSDGLNADLAILLGLPIILVVENRLGCINQTLLTIEAIEKHQLKLLAVVLNTVKQTEIDGMDNEQDLKSRIHYPVISIEHTGRNEQALNDITSLLLN